MTFLQLVLKSFRFYLKRNLLVMAGVALTTAILTGALMIGDSMRFSLKQIVNSRLGNATYVVEASDRYFTTSLADALTKSARLEVAPLFIINGSAIADGGQNRVNRVQFIGTDDRFSPFAGTDIYRNLSDNEVIINNQLARRLNVKAGDALLFRMAKASLVPLNTPFVSDTETSVSFRATIRQVAGGEERGDFNLQNAQSTPFNVFLPLDKLNRLMEMEGRSNRLLVAGEIPFSALDSALNASLTPADAGLKFDFLPDKAEFGITSDRIFLDSLTWDLLSGVEGKRDILTYFVNAIRSGERGVPYSFVSSWNDIELEEGEIILNDWTAGDLKTSFGDSVTLTWFEVGPLRQLVEKSARLKVSKVVPMNGDYGDSSLMPFIPGLSDAGHCREWEAGVPVQLDQIRDKDEAYWNRYKGTPKAFVSYDFAKKHWSNRFGSSTAIRIPSSGFSEEEFREHFSRYARAADFGIFVRPVKAEGLKAAEGGTDFGQLFLGLSFFLLLTALLITALLFRLNLETREKQIGTMVQLGFSRKLLFRIFLAEGLLIALPGIAAGLLLGLLYVGVIFYFLNSIWFDIVRTSVILLNVRISTLVVGVLLSLVISGLSILFPLRNYLRKSVAILQKKSGLSSSKPKSGSIMWVGVLLLLIGLSVTLHQIVAGGSQIPGYFFISGVFFLSGWLWVFRSLISRNSLKNEHPPGLYTLLQRSASRHLNRSMAIVITFSLGAFLVIAVGANRQGLSPSGKDKNSGTGGFGFYAETVVPVLHDVNDRARRLAEGIDTTWKATQFYRMSGDDASCLNLNRVTNPSLLAVDVSELSGRFDFQVLADEMKREDPWLLLKEELPGGVIPAVADQTVIQWGLGMKTGDTLLYLGEKGDTLRLKLTGGLFPSIFQGHLLIDKSHFLRHYPSHSGSMVFLTREHEEQVKDELLLHYRDYGMDIVSTPEKLASFQSVTNTYLSIFMALGFLALAIGTLGILVVVTRTLLERRKELNIMQALGFNRRQLVLQMVAEYSGLLASALGIALLTAFLSLLPAILDRSLTISLPMAGLLFLGIVAHLLLWIAFVSSKQLSSGKITGALQTE